MKHRQPTSVRLLAASAALAVAAQATLAQVPDAPARRLRGILSKDQTWTGLILISDDLTIQDATVTVEPGTVIEFAHGDPASHPALIVGAPGGTGARLLLRGAADKPITIRSRQDARPGRLVVNIRSRIIPVRPPALGAHDGAAPAREPDAVLWQHIRFENMGYVRVRSSEAGKARLIEPAVSVNLLGAAHTLVIRDCVFDRTAGLKIRAGDGAHVTLAANRFTHPTQRASIEVFGHEGQAPAGTVTILHNAVESAISLRDVAATLRGNVLIGDNAAIVVRDDTSAETRIIGNYIHNTTLEDDGHYCLNCENPDALIADNVFCGGTTCVLNGSRRMSGNVFIAADKLTSPVVRNARTHQLVYALPPGAIFERNLLLGPAYSLLMPQPALTGEHPRAAEVTTVIRHNLFDGLTGGGRAVHLNALGRPRTPVSVFNNVFLRIPTLIFDEGRTSTTLIYADHNAVAPPAHRAFDQVEIAGLTLGGPGWGGQDINRKEIAALRLSARLPDRAPDLDDALLSGKLTPQEARRRLFETYRPRSDSPLVRAGRPVASGSRPSIGPLEPEGH